MIRVSRREMEIIADILKRLVPGSEARAFGSRCKGTNKEFSDLDLAVVRRDGEKFSFLELGDLREAFQESELPYRVDVVDYNAASPEFRRIIDAGYEVIALYY